MKKFLPQHLKNGQIKKIKGLYYINSHLSNKREVTLTDFEKFPPPQKKIHPPHLLISQIFFNLHSSFIRVMYQFFSKKSHPPRLFQPPRLGIWQLFHPLHVYSNLHVYQREESKQTIINIRKCLYFFDLTTLQVLVQKFVKFFRW